MVGNLEVDILAVFNLDVDIFTVDTLSVDSLLTFFLIVPRRWTRNCIVLTMLLGITWYVNPYFGPVK
jgi:hypothetical protein